MPVEPEPDPDWSLLLDDVLLLVFELFLLVLEDLLAPLEPVDVLLVDPEVLPVPFEAQLDDLLPSLPDRLLLLDLGLLELFDFEDELVPVPVFVYEPVGMLPPLVPADPEVADLSVFMPDAPGFASAPLAPLLGLLHDLIPPLEEALLDLASLLGTAAEPDWYSVDTFFAFTSATCADFEFVGLLLHETGPALP